MPAMPMETLQRLILGRLAELREQGNLGLTLRQVALRSADQLNIETLEAIVAGRPVKLTEAQIAGLAHALEIKVERVRLAVMDTGR